jgi:2-C-methyl-D-erythritol 4-phosphate cytidylyltransferase
MERYFGLVPAAGSGRRLGGALRKQYLEVGGAPLIAHAIRALLADRRIDCVFVVLSADDERFKQIEWADDARRVVPLYCGGETRTISVYNGLVAAADAIDLDDWVLVHDAARPCLAPTDVANLIDAMSATEIGGLLASPVADTLKEDKGDGRVTRTVDRSSLWRALTPQMFRYGTLLHALGGGRAQDASITDEASAVERLGFHPRLIAGMSTNIKVTLPEDLALVAAWLNNQMNRSD